MDVLGCGEKKVSNFFFFLFPVKLGFCAVKNTEEDSWGPKKSDENKYYIS